jgi:hypothetical protein
MLSSLLSAVDKLCTSQRHQSMRADQATTGNDTEFNHYQRWT